ncbi:leucyl/phenylalanyl-tRNA--protein transferase [Kangiella sp. HZ709]|uniref:leucyl/phenylalanyl-tRNA--protein transferase n=1 Tax=Kangiella sp. HZ709 TaxID=2666328 RepID=UPI0012B012CC|nr:leucyl/phenylalanyl-tRNA--protein transferase [Kangiella sp. HZ709]MRX26702.1 leucyl/phenylalanyl-tRNA--protein transferase [Kangiella sp. HZ709]
MSQPLIFLDDSPYFPSADLAQEEPNGLLAVGGDLSVVRLTKAYQNGIFPWYCEDEPILWWSPDPRCVFNLTDENPIHISKSLRRRLKKDNYQVVINNDFKTVIQSCSMPRSKQPDTWILPEMQSAYLALHQAKIAHSVEVYDEESNLIGGLYGVSLGKFFFGESMFSTKPDASKIALAHLAAYLKRAHFILIDCQVPNEHLYSLGAVDISRDNFLRLLSKHAKTEQPQNLFEMNKKLSWRKLS